MGNTEFYQNTSNLKKDFRWSDIFSDVTKPHTQEDKDKLLVSGCTTYMPTEASMLKDWTKPWLFARFALVGVLLVVLMYVFQYIALSYAIIAMLMFVPAFIAPITILLFFWEMNIPRNISLMDILKYVMFAGATSCTLTFIIRDIMLVSNDSRAYIVAPIPEELAKFILVYIIIKKLDCKYILNGLLVGAAVGAGFAAIESAGYAFNILLTDGTMASLHHINLLRGLLAVGGHSVWAPMYGAALAASKKNKPLTMSHIADKLVIITLFSAIILHTIWNFNIDELLVRFADLPIAYSLSYFLTVYYGKEIILIILAWVIDFKLLRKGIIQAISIGEKASASKQQNTTPNFASPTPPVIATPMQNVISVSCINGIFSGRSFHMKDNGSITFGRTNLCTVAFPSDTKGISGNHCEIKIKDGVPVLIDRDSTYGTFLIDGTKLTSNVPVKITNGMRFYLASNDNVFQINI